MTSFYQFNRAKQVKFSRNLQSIPVIKGSKLPMNFAEDCICAYRRVEEQLHRRAKGRYQPDEKCPSFALLVCRIIKSW